MSTRFPRGLLALSFLLHALMLAALQFWGASSRAVPQPDLDLRMVQLVGGGSNRPGWVRPPEAAPARQEQTPAEVTPPAEPARTEPAPAVRQTRPDTRAVPHSPTRGEAVKPTPATPAETRPAAGAATNPADGRGRSAESTSTTARADDGAGPKGPGVDMVSENSGSPGVGNWLRRSQGTLFQNFRYPARNSGRAAVYHFVVTPDGRITEIELVRESGDSVLDHAGLVSLRTSRLSPLPPEARLKGLGVTITFRD